LNDPVVRLVSVNVGQPRFVAWKGETVLTSIFKQPVTGPVAVVGTSLAGDRPADLKAHGGVDKAVYAYPAEHYTYWRQELDITDMPWGMFGENFTTEGLDEAAVRIGDRFAIGTAEFEVSQPRMPCAKLGLRFGRADMVQRFLRSRRLGFYLRVVREGVIEAGEPIRRTVGDPVAPSIADLALLETTERENVPLLERAVRTERLTASWRHRYEEQLQRLGN
jgi:MOSC domain-containing protein YiiM